MKIFIPMLIVASVTMAEPPVGDGYPGARSTHDHYHEHDNRHEHHGHQRTLSQEYGPPSLTSRNAPSDGYEYNAPNVKASSNTRGRSQFPPATVRVSFNQRFSSAAARNSSKAASRTSSQEHGNVREISETIGTPASKALSQEYGVPSISSARSHSSENSVPNMRSSPPRQHISKEYGAPTATRSNEQSLFSSNFRSALQSQEYTEPTSRSEADSHFHSYSTSSANSNKVSQDYDGPKSTFSLRTPSSTYGAPTSRSLTSSYGAPERNTQDYYSSQNLELSERYETPSAEGLSQEYSVPSSRSNQNTENVVSSYPSARLSPSSTYLPAARDVMPSQQYGVPEQDNQGYENARSKALNELLNQEPANYDFAYQIEDAESGSDFGHTETREENRAKGSYFVVLPDGTKQTVEYEADEEGFRPRISVEPANAAARSGGYDDNAQDLANQGPY